MKSVYKNHRGLSIILSSCTAILPFFLFVALAHAAPQYIPIIGIPGLTNQQTASLPDYINRVYFLTVTIGALYGVVKIAFAGVKYSMSDIITTKGDAIRDIQGVLLGLAILLIPFIVLKEINPNLVNLDVLSSAKSMKTTLKSGGTGTRSTPTYQEGDLNTVGTQIRTAARATTTSSQNGPITSNNTQNTNGSTNREILIPIRTGTDDEFVNIKAQCVVEMPGYTSNFWKDPARGKYVCRNY